MIVHFNQNCSCLIKKLLVIILLFIAFSCKNNEKRILLFVGSYTDKKVGQGIHVYDFNLNTGGVHLLSKLDTIINASYLKLSPNGEFLFSVLESQLETHGKVAAYKVNPNTGTLNLINFQDSGGRNPVHLEIDKTGTHLVVSNYSDPNIGLLAINIDGSLNEIKQNLTFKGKSVIKDRQDMSHIHSSNFSPDSNYLFVQDLGADKIHKFKVVQNNKEYFVFKRLSDIKVKPGSGPRHFTFHQTGNYAYSICELSGEILAYNYKDGNLELIQNYNSYAKKQELYRSADIHLSPDGKFLYTSNRGPEEHSIAIYSINENNGKLNLVGYEPTYGDHPRSFIIDPTGQFLLVANQFSNSIIVFRRNTKTGLLDKISKEITVNSPASLQMYSYQDIN